MPLIGVKHVHHGANIQLMGWSHKWFGKSLSLHSASPVCLCSVKSFLIEKHISTIQYSTQLFNVMHHVKRFIYGADALWWKLKISLKLTLSWFILQKPLACFITGLLWKGSGALQAFPMLPLFLCVSLTLCHPIVWKLKYAVFPALHANKWVFMQPIQNNGVDLVNGKISSI